MADFTRLSDVDAWVSAHSLDELKEAVEQGRFNNMSRAVAMLWLRRLGEQEAQRLVDEGRDLVRRTTVATELAATAAVDSASSARRSARWAAWAALIAFAALLVSVWPLVKDFSRAADGQGSAGASAPAADVAMPARPASAASR